MISPVTCKMLVKSNFINPTERSASRVAEASDVKVSHSTSQNAKTVDVYWYVLNVCIGTGSKFNLILSDLCFYAKS